MSSNKFYTCSRGPKTNFQKLKETQVLWEQKFWDKIRKTDNCWFWEGALNDSGYGVMGVYQLGYKKTKLEYTQTIIFFEKRGNTTK